MTELRLSLKHFDQSPAPANMPPALLRVMVCGTASPAEFLQAGQRTIAEFDAVLRSIDRSIAASRSILDVGCGCGRLARWIPRSEDQSISGVDINPAMVRWSKKALAGRWEHIRIGDPLPFEAANFDLAYACSVVTHLRETTTATWFLDLTRVLEPGGILLVTFHDEFHASAKTDQLQRALHKDGFAIEIDRMEGSNRLAAYATIDRLAQLAGQALKLRSYTKSPDTVCGQAIALFQRSSTGG